MTPVVYGLQEEYADRVAFNLLNAESREGSSAFRALELVGHPSFLVLSPSGEVLWRAFGPQPIGVLRGGIDAALETFRDDD